MNKKVTNAKNILGFFLLKKSFAERKEKKMLMCCRRVLWSVRMFESACHARTRKRERESTQMKRR